MRTSTTGTAKIRLVILKLTALVMVSSLGTPPARAGTDLWPLYESSADGTTVLYPLYVHEGEFLMAFPFYYRTNKGHDTHVLWPMLKTSDGSLKRAVPFYFKQEDAFTLFPLIHQTPSATLWFVPPMYFRADGSFSAIVPLYIKSKQTLFIFPNLYRRENDAGAVADFAIWPLFRHQHEERRDRVASMFVFDHVVAPDSGHLWVLPYYQSHSPEGATKALLPFYYGSQEGTRQYTWVLPYYQSHSNWHSSQGVFPFFGQRRERTSDGGNKRTWNVLWPIYRRHVETDANGKIRERNRRFLIFSDRLDSEGRRTVRILGLPIMERVQ